MPSKEDKGKMVVVGGVRYRESVAKRLGLAVDGKAITANSQQRATTTTAHVAKMQAAAKRAAEQADKDKRLGNAGADATTTDRPADSNAKKVWVAYALANGKTEQDLEGLTRDQIAELFPVDAAATGGSDGDTGDGSGDGDDQGEGDGSGE